MFKYISIRLRLICLNPALDLVYLLLLMCFDWHYIGKNPSPTLAKDKTKQEYISEGQPSPLELAFGVELGLYSHSKNLRWYQSISKINPKGHPPLLSTHQAQEMLGVWGCIGKNPNPTSAKNKAKLEYISEGQPLPLELAFGVELGLNLNSKNLRHYM